MQDAKLQFDGREARIDRDVISIGRTPDNDVSFPGDSNVSRHHAEIERRGGDHYLIDLKSSNGTTVNGKNVADEVRLSPGDKIVFGGSSEAVFLSADSDASSAVAQPETFRGSDAPGSDALAGELSSIGSQAASEAEYAAANAISGSVGSAAAAPTSSSTIMVAGVVGGLALVFAFAAIVFYATRGSACSARAVITKPEPGDTISGPVEIEVNAENVECVQRAVYTVDGREVATAEPPLFAATLDPKDVPELADGVDHLLEIVLIDTAGERIPQTSQVMVAFETRAVTKPEATPLVTQTNTQPSKPTGRGQPSLIQINDMSQKLVKQIAGNFAYNVSNKQFLQEVQKRTAEYAQEGYYQRALAYRDVINVAFVREQNIPAPFGFVLAMSRSKFNAAKQGDLEGLWQMSNVFVTDNKYNGLCGTETLSDPSQNCAAKSAALYMKSVVFGVFDGDLIYSAAAFGRSPQDAGAWKATLPANRSDVWNSIRTAPEREQLLRFFAAGIVTENPQAFGLSKDRPLSELYRVTM